METRTKIVFLYTEVAGYFLACVKELVNNADILIIRYPINKEAPFKFNTLEGIKIIDKSTLSEQELESTVVDFNPSVIVCSGWIDKNYLSICKKFKRNIPVVLSLDNQWEGRLKQKIACLVSPITLKRIFTHAWVPGKPQAIYASKLGFKNNVILNFYCADTSLFGAIYQNTFHSKMQKFPHRFLYVARYVEHKGIFEMWNAFAKLCNDSNHDWELWCLGTGDQWEKRMEHPKIKHVGFIQPNEMEQYVLQTGVYILPSKFEPWGVSLQEFAISGFPILVSDKVGSATKFLSEKNGFVFQSGNENEIYLAMKKIISKSDNELIEMGKESHAIGMSLTPIVWSETILGLVKK